MCVELLPALPPYYDELMRSDYEGSLLPVHPPAYEELFPPLPPADSLTPVQLLPDFLLPDARFYLQASFELSSLSSSSSFIRPTPEAATINTN